MTILLTTLIMYFTIGLSFALISFIFNLDLPVEGGTAYVIAFIEKTIFWPKYIIMLWILFLISKD